MRSSVPVRERDWLIACRDSQKNQEDLYNINECYVCEKEKKYIYMRETAGNGLLILTRSEADRSPSREAKSCGKELGGTSISREENLCDVARVPCVQSTYSKSINPRMPPPLLLYRVHVCVCVCIRVRVSACLPAIIARSVVHS